MAKIKIDLLIYCLIAYSLTSFANSLYETNFLSNLNIRVDGHENAVPFGMFTATVFGLLGVFVVYKKDLSTLLKCAIIICLILALITTILSGSRSAYLLILIFISLYIIHKYTFKHLVIFGAFSAISIITIVTIMPNNAIKQRIYETQSAFDYFSDPSTKNRGSFGARVDQWNEAFCIFSKHPILGAGPRSFRNAHQKYGGKDDCNGVQPQPYYQLKGGSYQAHSLYFNTLATTGIIGLLITLFLFWSIYKISNSPRIPKEISLILVTSILAHLFNGITLDLWFRNHVVNKNLLILSIPVAIALINISSTKTLKILTKT